MIQFLLLSSLSVTAAFWNRFLIMNYYLPQATNVTHITFSSPFLSLFSSEQSLDSVTGLQFGIWRHVFQNLASSSDLYQQKIEKKGKSVRNADIILN